MNRQATASEGAPLRATRGWLRKAPPQPRSVPPAGGRIASLPAIAAVALGASAGLAMACSPARSTLPSAHTPSAATATRSPASPAVPLGAPLGAPLAVPTVNWIDNGDFSETLDPWSAHAIAAAPGHTVRAERIDGALCTHMLGGESVILGWPVSGSPQRFELTAGERYQLALRTAVSGDLPVRCVVKVGHQVAPYAGAFSETIPTTSEWTAFETEFAPDHADDQAGLAVECQSQPGPARALVCVDDVRLRPYPKGP